MRKSYIKCHNCYFTPFHLILFDLCYSTLHSTKLNYIISDCVLLCNQWQCFHGILYNKRFKSCQLYSITFVSILCILFNKWYKYWYCIICMKPYVHNNKWFKSILKTTEYIIIITFLLNSIEYGSISSLNHIPNLSSNTLHIFQCVSFAIQS